MIFSRLGRKLNVFLLLIMIAVGIESSFAIPGNASAELRLKMVTCPGKITLDKTIVNDVITMEPVDLTKERVVLVEAEGIESVPIGAKEPDESLVWVVKDGKTGPSYHAYSEETFNQLAKRHPGALPDPITRRDLRNTDKILISLPDSKSTRDLIENGKILENEAVKTFFSRIEKGAIYRPSIAPADTNGATRVRWGLIIYGTPLATTGGGILVGILVSKPNNNDPGSSDVDHAAYGASVSVERSDFPGNWQDHCTRARLTSDGTLKAFCSRSSGFIRALYAVELENAVNCLEISVIVSDDRFRLSCERWK